MKRLIFTVIIEAIFLSHSYSADLTKKPIVESGGGPAPVWTGFYGGLFAGYGALDSATRFDCIGPNGVLGAVGCPIIATRKGTDDAFIAGGEIGYNRLFGAHLLVGGAADYQFTRLWDYGAREGTFQAVGGGDYPLSTAHAGQRLDNLATLRGKVGLATGPTLVYATGGLAVGNVRIDSTQALLGQFGPSFDARHGEVRLGYVVGAGLEYAFSEHLSAKVEGLYYNLGSHAVFDDTTDYRIGARASTDGFLARVGLNYRFGDGVHVPPAGVAPGGGVWDFEGGVRYFYSSGGPRYTLGSDRRPGQVNSRLTYQDTDGHAGEGFARIDHNPTGLFAKGFLGSGGVTSGRLYDEDFPPAIRPYSKTLSQIKDGDISYGVVDLGYTALRRDGFSLGGFIGYQYDAELANGYGCTQVAGGTICARRNAVASDINVLSENLRWDALRIGLIGAARFDRFKISLEGAYLPVVTATGVDRHWLRPNINPLPQTGDGDGYFAEGIVSYDLTPAVSIGFGGRYWRMQTGSGRIKFPFSPGSPTKFETDRYGVFAQISYKLSDLGLGGSDAQPVLARKD
ncbi:putative outer membrane protein [Methylobacterium sp. GXF4]|uniref:outer membrane beta-barrel protein n=1 Tax=Methylobacterium sp. GXF4 TaxID=1096546 RepID=UPI000269894F|nr:outer membrane beta-barrel protein [Methylobacterium sp. GXF4]EIZ86572.1 putative outer membrane protein [Methylobacterium sp. GXF4]